MFFGTFVTVTQEKKGRTRGIGGTERVIFTERTDGYDAKNRYGMPERIELPEDPAKSWSSVWQHINGTASAEQQASAVPDL